MDKKLAGGAAGLIAAVMYGGSMVFDQEARITALEDIHPELFAEVLGDDAEPEPEAAAEEEAEPEPEAISDEDQIEAEEAEAEAQPPIEAGE